MKDDIKKQKKQNKTSFSKYLCYTGPSADVP